MGESSVGKQIQIALSNLGARLFRNNVGMLEDARGGKVRYGLCEGSSDYIGWFPITITPEMVGRRIAVFTAIEVKTPGARTDKDRLEKQHNFVNAVNSGGGIAFFAESVEDAQKLLKL